MKKEKKIIKKLENFVKKDEDVKSTYNVIKKLRK